LNYVISSAKSKQSFLITASKGNILQSAPPQMLPTLVTSRGKVRYKLDIAYGNFVSINVQWVFPLGPGARHAVL